jgi:hypothetical protein
MDQIGVLSVFPSAAKTGMAKIARTAMKAITQKASLCSAHMSSFPSGDELFLTTLQQADDLSKQVQKPKRLWIASKLGTDGHAKLVPNSHRVMH